MTTTSLDFHGDVLFPSKEDGWYGIGFAVEPGTTVKGTRMID